MSNSIRFDLNRMRKTYPLIRRKPRFRELGTFAGVELGQIIFNNSTSEVYTFKNTYTSLPICVITPENDNVNIYISALSLTSVTIDASFEFTGKVHIHVYEDVGD